MNIRKDFIEFFTSKKHQLYKSSPLIPDDESLMFINAGMVPFKDIFTGKIPTPNPDMATSCQLCLRTGGKHNDLENVGYTNRHHTLFEMLGNFSFGSYFKKEAIEYSYEFLTQTLKLDLDKLWFTVYDNDDEAFNLWADIVPKDRIKRLGKKDNFWQMGNSGPCGPCSEIFYDQGDKFNSSEDYLGGEGDRFLEIWNLVFMQYEMHPNGGLTPLKKPYIDTGMGLERVYAIMENVHSNFESSLFMPIIKHIEKLSNVEYIYDKGSSFRVIADHIRAICFMLSEGITFDKDGRGYVLRRLLRRAVRHGYLLGFRESFLFLLVDDVIAIMGDTYESLEEKEKFLKENIKLEEERFFATIENGMKLFNKELETTKDIFSGEVAFKLYDTYGFPLDLTEDMLIKNNIKIDIEAYDKAMQNQKEKARANWSGSGEASKSANFKEIIDSFGINEFIGYENNTSTSKIISLYDNEFNSVNSLAIDGWVLLDKTPFYAESGGQVGDKGSINDIEVIDTKKFFELNLSQVRINNAKLELQDTAICKVEQRDEVKKHHSATHLLQSALREILGDGVHQAGSYNDANRLRFDFTYPKAIENQELQQIENIVNENIFKSIDLSTEELSIDEAKKKGAIAMFGEKYGDMVRVVSFDKESIEFCGGTHIENTSKIGSFIITKQSSVSSGVRRIEAICGKSANAYMKDVLNKYQEAKFELKNENIIEGILKLKENIKELKTKLKNNNSTKELKVSKIKDLNIIIEQIDDGNIKEIIDIQKNKYENIVIVIFQVEKEKAKIFCSCKNTNIKANSLVKEISPILNARGGGKDSFATAGGGDVATARKN